MLESETKIQVIDEIRKVEILVEIVQVFIDQYDDNKNLFELCDYTLNDIDTIYVNRVIANEFEQSILMQVATNSNCTIKYFK